MPFMKGPSPIRRTLKYLDAGKLILKDMVNVFSVNFNPSQPGTDHHKGARDFVFWHLAPIQYKNPDVQVVTLRNMTPSPFIRCYLDNGEEVLIDIDSKSKEEILQHVIRVIGKSEDVLYDEAKVKEKRDNPANFGFGCEKRCICEIPGQLPCPAVVPLPFHMRGKYKFAKD